MPDLSNVILVIAVVLVGTLWVKTDPYDLTESAIFALVFWAAIVVVVLVKLLSLML